MLYLVVRATKIGNIYIHYILYSTYMYIVIHVDTAHSPTYTMKKLVKTHVFN